MKIEVQKEKSKKSEPRPKAELSGMDTSAVNSQREVWMEILCYLDQSVSTAIDPDCLLGKTPMKTAFGILERTLAHYRKLIQRASKDARREFPMSTLTPYARRAVVEKAVCRAVGDCFELAPERWPKIYNNDLWPLIRQQLASVFFYSTSDSQTGKPQGE
jgi:hypothetical protein